MKLILALLALASFSATAAERPNIIVIMADDIGMECIRSYNPDSRTETPNLDKLAASGMRFKNAHAQPLCTPSRVQIMTGIYNNRNYVKFGLLDPKATTFGNVLRDAGYKTAIAGKWQLDGGFEGPKGFGFDNYCLWQLTRRPSRYPNPGFEIDGVEKDFKDGSFGPDIVTDYINDYISAHKAEPFFVYYPMIAPHWPFVPTPDHPDWDPDMWRDKESEPRGYMDDKYWDAMVLYTDKMVGRVVDHLEAEGLRENTLVIWTGDNGTYESVTTPFKGRDYQGGKSRTTDNGTHVGFIASWPGKIKANQVVDDLVDFSDVLPTLVDVAGAKSPEGVTLDGTSLAPLFEEKEREKDFIYCWYERNGVRSKASQHVRNANYKLYATDEFYDIVTDPLEKNNLRGKDTPAIEGEAQTVYKDMKTALDKHVAVTKLADPLQLARQADFKKKKKSKK